MSLRVVGVVGFLILVIAAPRAARGDEPAPEANAAASQSRWAQRPRSILVHLGIATPVGNLGAMFDWAFHPAFSLSGGLGMSSDSGLQTAAMLRARLPLRVVAPYLAGGVSEGRYHWQEIDAYFDTCSCAAKDSPLAWWANAEVGLEGIAAAGFTGRLYLGYGHMLNPESLVCTKALTHCETSFPDAGQQLLYLGLALGYSF
jgi:hypothetical protein